MDPFQPPLAQAVHFLHRLSGRRRVPAGACRTGMGAMQHPGGENAAMPTDLFAEAGLQPVSKPLTVFRAELLSHAQTGWEELSDGSTNLKAITFSSGLEFLLRLAGRLEDTEIVFGSESILSTEHWALAQASQTVQADA